jgi:hypothetical protein
VRRRQRAPGPDAYEQAVLRVDPEAPALSGEPMEVPRHISTRVLLGLLAVVIAGVTLAKVAVGDRYPSVHGSCTAPAYALDRTHVKQYGVVAWAATGAATDHFVLGVDTAQVPADRAHGRLFPQVPLTGCRAHGRFGVLVAPGRHVVTAFLVAPDGTARAVGSTTLQVDAP